LLVLEESIPLIVLYSPGTLPSTGILTSLRERSANRREKQRAFSEAGPSSPGVIVSTSSVSRSVGNTYALGLCRLLSLSTWGPAFRHWTRIERHMKSVVAYDALLVMEGVGNWLMHPELLEALEERGMCVDPF
ncbi:hypothetical protein BGW80DRAFT_1165563, partial [Lactifluus volemus]